MKRSGSVRLTHIYIELANWRHTMYKYESSIFIKRPPQEVLDYATNPANDVKWRGRTQSAAWTSDGPPGVSSTIKVVTSMLGRKIEAAAEVTALDPPSLIRIKSVGGPVPFEGTTKLAAQGDGTLLTQMVRLKSAVFSSWRRGWSASRLTSKRKPITLP